MVHAGWIHETIAGMWLFGFTSLPTGSRWISPTESRYHKFHITHFTLLSTRVLVSFGFHPRLVQTLFVVETIQARIKDIKGEFRHALTENSSLPEFPSLHPLMADRGNHRDGRFFLNCKLLGVWRHMIPSDDDHFWDNQGA